jgi:hypothetical protein
MRKIDQFPLEISQAKPTPDTTELMELVDCEGFDIKAKGPPIWFYREVCGHLFSRAARVSYRGDRGRCELRFMSPSPPQPARINGAIAPSCLDKRAAHSTTTDDTPPLIEKKKATIKSGFYP